VTALRNGASEGQIFEILRPVGASHFTESTVGRDTHPLPLLSVFATWRFIELVNASPSELLAWFEGPVQSLSFRLRRRLRRITTIQLKSRLLVMCFSSIEFPDWITRENSPTVT